MAFAWRSYIIVAIYTSSKKASVSLKPEWPLDHADLVKGLQECTVQCWWRSSTISEHVSQEIKFTSSTSSLETVYFPPHRQIREKDPSSEKKTEIMPQIFTVTYFAKTIQNIEHDPENCKMKQRSQAQIRISLKESWKDSPAQEQSCQT